MKSWLSVALAVFTVGSAVALAWKEPDGVSQPSPAPSASVAAVQPEPEPTTEPHADELPIEAPPERAETPGYDVMPDGSPVPDLPTTAPRAVTLGIILFEYEGAQPPLGQNKPLSARPKGKALELAKEALAAAQEDFAKAVEKGDRGSTSNAGRIPRGYLEKSIEYRVFTLEKGALAPEPIDTPRGYWVVRRIL